MNLYLPASDLQRAVASVAPVVPSKSTLPALECLKLHANGSLTISASDLEISASANAPARIRATGEVLVPGKLFADIVKAIPSGEVSLTQKKAQLEIGSASGTYTLSTSTQMPTPVTATEFTGSVEIPEGFLLRLLSLVGYAVSNDELRPSMNGVLCRFGNTSDFVATDGHRLAWLQTDLSASEAQVIVPAKALSIAAKTFSAACVLEYSHAHVSVTDGRNRLTARLIDERYPNFEAVIPKENDSVATINRSALLSSVKRVSIMAHANTRQLALTFEADTVTIKAQNVDAGNEGEERVPCDYSADPLTIGFNGTFLVDALSHMECEEITIALSSPTRAAILRPVGTTDYTVLVMPVRLHG